MQYNTFAVLWSSAYKCEPHVSKPSSYGIDAQGLTHKGGAIMPQKLTLQSCQLIEASQDGDDLVILYEAKQAELAQLEKEESPAEAAPEADDVSDEEAPEADDASDEEAPEADDASDEEAPEADDASNEETPEADDASDEEAPEADKPKGPEGAD